MGRWTTDYSSSIHTNTLVSEKIGPVIMHVQGQQRNARAVDWKIQFRTGMTTSYLL